MGLFLNERKLCTRNCQKCPVSNSPIGARENSIPRALKHYIFHLAR
jgi:hypothetical protein